MREPNHIRAVKENRAINTNFVFRTEMEIGDCEMDGTVEDISEDTFPSSREREHARRLADRRRGV